VPADWFKRNRNVALARISSNIKGIDCSNEKSMMADLSET
jgi:hypothetical protein